MTRYTRTNTQSIKRCPNGVGIFVGWDDLDTPSEEATEVTDLGLTMRARDRAEFMSLEPGETKSSGLFTYFREH